MQTLIPIIAGLGATALAVAVVALALRRRQLARLPIGFQTAANLKTLTQAEKALKNNRPAEAAALLEQVGLVDRAAELYEKLRNFAALGALFERMGKLDRSARCFEQAGDLPRAASTFMAAGMLQQAAECYARAKQYGEAAHAYRQAGLTADAAQMYERSGDVAQALILYGQAKDYVRYARLVWSDILARVRSGRPEPAGVHAAPWDAIFAALRQAGEWALLGNLAAFESRWELAAEAAAKQGRQEDAVALYRKAEAFEQSALILNELGRPADAELDLARHYEQTGDWEGAAHHYQKGGNSERAVHFLLKAGQTGEAAELMLNRGNAVQAAELFAQAGDWSRAGQAWHQAGEIARAAGAFAQTSERLRAAQLYVQVEQFKAAGDLYAKEDQTDEAVKSYQRHLRSNPDDAEVAEKVAALLERKELFASAAETYNTLIGGRPVSDGNIAYYYRLGRLNERQNKFAQARLIYEKILAYDLAYEDVPQRIDILKRQEMLDEIGAGATGSRSSSNASQPQRYRISRELGHGGMGTVYLAQDTILGRNVALKVLNTRDLSRDAVDRMMQEARISARLNHPNIITIFDVSLTDGQLYLSMEYVEGQTLKEIITEQGPLAVTPFLLLFGQAAQGLSHAHGQSVVHRDIKPANLMWTKDRKAKLMDFGLAVAVQEMANTQTLVAGTPNYMAPEQVMGDVVDGRADLYALGVTMYEAIVGERPFAGRDVGYHHVHTLPASPKAKRPGVPEDVSAMIMRCLNKKPAERYQTADELFEEIKRIAQNISRG